MNLTKRRKSDGGLFQASTTGYFRYFTPKDKLKWNDPARVKVPMQRTGADQLTGGGGRPTGTGWQKQDSKYHKPVKGLKRIPLAFVLHM